MTDLATTPRADGASDGDVVTPAGEVISDVEAAESDATIDDSIDAADDAVLDDGAVEAEADDGATDDIEAETKASDIVDAEPSVETDAAADAEAEAAAETAADASDDVEADDDLEADVSDDVEGADEAEAADELETENDADHDLEAEAEVSDDVEAADAAEAADELETGAEAADDAADDVETEDEVADDTEAEDNASGDEAEAEAELEAVAEDDDENEAADDTVGEGETDAEDSDVAEAETAAIAETDAIAEADNDAAAAGEVAAPEDEASVDEAVEDEVTEAAPTTLAPTVALPVAEAQNGAEAAGATEAVYAWAPAEPAPKKKHTAIWISAAAGVAVVGLVVSSLVLIAPGTTVAGVPVGWLTPGAAADAIEQQLAETTVVLTGEGGDAEITGAELGALVDARALADAAFAEHPMWNPTAWFATTGAEIELDPATATDALRDAAPQLYTDPVNAQLEFDAATASYVATPAVPGAGIDVATVQDAIQAAFEAGEKRVELDPVGAEVPADISTETADETVAKLNGMLDTAGFYVGDERTVPVDRAVAASWLTVTPEEDGFEITADAEAIQPMIDGLAAAVNRAPENAIEITDTGGNVLQEIAAGQSGRQLGDTADVADDFAAQLAIGDAAYKLPVDEVPVSTTTLARNIVVDLSDQRAYFYENGVVVSSTAMSSGLPGHDTHTGNYRIRAKLASQNMGNPDTTKAPFYYTKNVPWVMYFNGDQALHGAYWHNNFGHRMSHGCVNLPVSVAKFLYDWAPMGTEVRVQA